MRAVRSGASNVGKGASWRVPLHLLNPYRPSSFFLTRGREPPLYTLIAFANLVYIQPFYAMLDQIKNAFSSEQKLPDTKYDNYMWTTH